MWGYAVVYTVRINCSHRIFYVICIFLIQNCCSVYMLGVQRRKLIISDAFVRKIVTERLVMH